jgi:hypothetical protein
VRILGSGPVLRDGSERAHHPASAAREQRCPSPRPRRAEAPTRNAPQRLAPAAARRLREGERLSAAALGERIAAAAFGSARGARCPRPARVATAREPLRVGTVNRAFGKRRSTFLVTVSSSTFVATAYKTQDTIALLFSVHKIVVLTACHPISL